ncbi:YSIRK-type signal peptide-containing protein [Streptococcus sp. 202]|uniref:mucin-binding protein n=2 Tax=unclassified Streptococcus TaxID=2608887 RepID=UPI001563279E|nr:YSIRK-type signal peptide-containing protein [Streptococcus sp. 202]
MGKFDKQLKYSIRKVSVGAASVVIGAFYLAMGAGVVHAETNTTTDGGTSHSSPSPEPETSRPNGLTSSSYGAEPAQNPSVSGKPTESTTPKEKENNETLNAAQPTEASTSANTRGRRSKRDVGNPPADGTSNTSTGTETPAGASTGNNEALNSAVTERKGSTVQANQLGITIPKGEEPGADDPNAHLKFDDPGEGATVEEMWKIIQNMPDDFQNNERSYLRNMDTLGEALRFDKTEANPEGVPLQPGEIREISSFGGWKAIMKKDGTTGKFAVGMKNEQGYFTGWYNKNGERQEGGMLGSNALDEIYVHEQALDRRFNYMLMLAKGRTIANRTDKAQDGTTFNIKTPNNSENKANLAALPVKEKEDILQHAPNIEGFNGIEKTFTAFSTAYGSRLKIEFVTGYISDFEGSKGTYRIVVKAIKKNQTEETVYDHTINRIDGVVENEERYAQGVNLSRVNNLIKNLLKDEYGRKVNTIANDKFKKKYPSIAAQKKNKEELAALKEEAKQELAKKGEVTYELPIDKDELKEVKTKFKEGSVFTVSYATVANKLNNELKNITDRELQKNSPTWMNPSEENPDKTVKSKDPDRVYKLLDFVLPTAKKIIYHADTDQLELQTDPEKVTKHREELKARLAAKEAERENANEDKKIELNKEISALKSAIGSTNAYTYTEARNGSKEVRILGSHMEATKQPPITEMSEADYTKYGTNESAAKYRSKGEDGLAVFTAAFVEKNNVTRSNVLADAELSKKITEEIGGDKDKLGKGGYFSTGDIPLDKDVVAYKIQVFAENEKRVGVNMQSPRLQYNLPILADFSVIQDTVEPSKEVSRRIITKLKEKGKITEEEEKKIKDKIDKSKKTSELRSAMSGNVKVRYVDEQGQDIPLPDEEVKKVGEKSENGTYFVEKEVLIGTSYNVTSKQLRGINTGEKKYRLKRSLNNGLSNDSAAVTGEVTSADKVVTFVYEEGEATKAKAVVHVMKQSADNSVTELPEHKINLETEVGEEFPSTDVDAKVSALKKAGYEIVSNTFTNGTPESRKGDDQEDLDGQEPTQSYTITVQERTKEVTEPPTPNDPVDPEIPDGPKWPETGLAKSDLEKEVTRTITYVKKETADGPEEPSGKEPVTQPAHFKRSATYNLVTKVVTPGNWGSTDNTLTAVPTEKLEGYIADRASVEAVTVPDTSGNITEKVVYTKLGSWVPNLPKGVTPPEGTDMTPKPYPNHPTDPTKPGDPTPGLIPYVPGYTPNVGGTPLVPKNPTDLTEGYTPPTPTDPKTNIEINYTPDPQKAVVKVYTIRDGVKIELPNEKVSIDSGIPDATIPSTKLDEKIKDLEKRGYIVDNKTPLKGETFDKVKDSETGDPSQVYELILRERTSVETETKSVTRTIKYYKIDETNGSKVEVDNGNLTNTKTAEFTREVTTNLATGLTTIGAWSDKQTLDEVKTPVLTGYIADKVKIPSSEVTAETESFEEEVVYKKIGSWVPKVPGVETPTPIPYPNDPKDPTKPKYPDYPTTPENPGETPTPQPDNPGGGNETPGDDTPGTPEKPKTPELPVIPYEPGYTPGIPTDPTQPVDPKTNPLVPLTPVDPKDPKKGYKVPEIPTTPGKDTSITYEANPQKALVKVVKVEGEGENKTETPLTGDYVNINGKTGEEIPDDSVTAKIADLEKRGYIIENKDDVLNFIKEKFDKDKDTEGQDPTQTVTLKVHEKVVEVTEPPTPNTPVDPNVPVEPNVPVDPTIPKWPAEGLKESDLKKEVTRTITYVKKETADGPEEPSGKAPVTQTAHFTRKASYNVVTGAITYGNWESTDNTLTAVPTEKLEGYIADRASVEEVTVPDTSGNITEKVVYTKLGSWVPNLPEGVKPPEGTDMTPKPYPNNPNDPTKPGTPVYPEPGQPIPPGTPVIPYVPGYTPKIGDKPLEPVDPNNPENGYKVPPVPTEPGTNTDITYVADPQKAVVKVFNTTTGTDVELPAEKVSIDNGTTDSAIPTDSVTAKIADLEKRGYVVENKDLLNNQKFDNEKDPTDGDPTQVFNLKVHEKLVPVTPPTDDKPLKPGKPIDPDVPVVPNTPVDPKTPVWTEELINKVKNAETTKEVTRTINYVDESGTKLTYTDNGKETTESKTDKVTFTREAKINVVTGEITYGEWTAKDNDTTFDEVTSPVVKGYILKSNQDSQGNLVSTDGTRVAASTNLTAASENQNLNVVYTKLGSWVLTPPTGVTPPEGTNFDPKPYPNNPTDPTRPGDPTDPTTPNVPVIPYVPGYTPKTPDGNPLVPVDPNHPENGYKVPPVPTKPGEDTPIEYVKVPNTPSPEEPVKPTPESNHITIWVDENGKPLKPEKPGTHEPGNIPGYRYITTVTKDGVTIHKFEKITPVEPNNPVPQKPTTPIPTPQDPTIPTPESQIPTPNTPEATTPTSETSRREELPNTGTEANATLASAGIMTLLAGLGLGFFKKKEEDESE